MSLHFKRVSVTRRFDYISMSITSFMQSEVRIKAVIYISIRVGRTQGFDILVLKLISAYIKSILLNNAFNACVAVKIRLLYRAKSFDASQ